MSPSDPDETPTRMGGDAQPPPGQAAGARGRAPETEKTIPSFARSGAAGQAAAAAGKPANQDPLIGTELGGCVIESMLGRGAMGAVYRAKQRRLDREVAVKVIRPDLLADDRILKRFEVEARIVGRFNSPNVVMVHDVGFERGVHFLVMEFVRGKNLRDHVKLLAGGRLPAGEAIPLLRQACKGLEEAQRLGVLHRDVKPDNLMLTERGVLKIADFGIAKPTQEDFSMTLTSELIGTPLYMSPEQCQAATDLDFRSDMYSLGATFYYLLTGEPPVRASSVYELIQTKTKLENLCLWKALPELDENHPLSRVIERMTALDREDRYPSYEALLNDLVLVEHGRTIDRLPKVGGPASGRGKTARPAKQSRGRTVALVAGVLLAAAGGGYAWVVYGPTANAGAMDRLDAAAVAARLQTLRGTLADSGPSARLRSDVAALAAEAPLAAERDALLADVDRGLSVQGRLREVKAPSTLELPFADLKDHLQAVEAALVVDGPAGPELQRWLAAAKTTARAERELGALGLTRLAATLAAWQQDRAKVGGDERQIAELGQRLDAIDAGRRTLLELLPSLREAADRDFPLATLEEARRGLVRGAEAMTPVVDLARTFAEIRAEFDRDGPDLSIVERTRALRPTAPAQLDERDGLLDAMQKAQSAREQARAAKTNSFPAAPQLPFDDVANYFATLDRALQPLANAEGALPAWAAAERAMLRDGPALQAKVLQRCRDAFAAVQQKQAQKPSGAELQELALAVRDLERGLRRARDLFPEALAELDALVPPAALDSARAGLDLAVRKNQWFAGAVELGRKFEKVATPAEWRAVSASLLLDLEQGRARAADFGDDPEVARELQRVQGLADRWRDTDTRLQGLAVKFAAGDLAGVDAALRAGVAGVAGRDELQALGSAGARCAAAFAALDQELDIDRALASLAEAKALHLPHAGLAPAVGDRIEAWSRALQALQRAAADLVPIPAGRTKAGPAGPFFVARTEATQADWQRFLGELKAGLGNLEGAARTQALAERFGDVSPAEELLSRMLDRASKLRSPTMPIDALSWFEAAAYVRWYGQALPTEAEWALAAFGDGNRSTYPWGNDWKDDDACRNIGSELVPAASGGRSWRSSPQATIHHLAGNAAEWLQATPSAAEGLLAGGRCQDNRQEARRRAAGLEFHRSSLQRALPGFGFRAILRPREFLAARFPDGRFPPRAQ